MDFYLNKAKGDVSDSYLFPTGDSYTYIKKSYINEIDKRMIAASLAGSKVYIRLLVDNVSESLSSTVGVSGERYGLPDLYSTDVLDFVSAVTEFLAQRYDGNNGQIYGFIPSTSIDVALSQAIDQVSVDEYADLYTLYLVVVGSASRVINNQFDIVIPLSDSINTSQIDQALSSVLLENIIKRLDDNVSGVFDCSLMIETSNTPEIISDVLLQNNENNGTPIYISPDNIGDYISYIRSLDNKYESTPLHIIYKWTPSMELTGNSLCCSYIYSYLKLISYDRVSSFTVDLSGDAKINYSDLEKVFCDIDTSEKARTIDQYASCFGADSWEEIIDSSVDIPTLRTVVKQQFYKEAPNGIKGEFCYMSFSSSLVFETMTTGQNCISSMVDYDPDGMRVLRVTSDAMEVGEYMETVGVFEYPESYIYTDTLSLKIALDSTDENAIYEIMLTLGNLDKRINVTGTLCSGESAVMYFDVKEFSDISNANYIKISARCLTGETKGISLLLHDVTGYSTEYDSETLEKMIYELRQSLRGQADEEESEFNKTMIITIITVVICLIAVGIGLFMVFRREEDSSRN